MSKIKGCFVFRNEGNGCLASTYLEHKTKTPYTECCKQKGEASTVAPFEGDFDTCWIEPDNSHKANLAIRNKGEVYNLKWTDISNSDWEYEGTAMIFEGKLVGCYWKS